MSTTFSASEDSSTETWRAAFLDSGTTAGPHPASEALFEGAAGRIGPSELQPLLDHVAACAQCSEAWRLAVELREELERSTGASAAILPFRQRSAVLWALAAIVLCAIALGVIAPRLTQDPTPPPIFRGDETIVVATVDAAGLSKSNFTLRWQLQPPPPPGIRYDLVVTTADLQILVDLKGLERNHFEVGADRLSDVAIGDEILWRVIAHLPDGRRASSPTFRHQMARE
jgi:hypothetical protein